MEVHKEQTSLEKVFTSPHYEVSEVHDGFEVKVFMPSITKKDVNISLHNNELTIAGYRSYKTPESWKPLRQELHELNYKLQLKLNAKIDAEKVKANVSDGVLTLNLPIAESAKARIIPLK